MSGLVLKLGPNERILINGAVIENGLRRTRLNIVTPNANILRLRDAIHPDEARTPVRRVCYIAQLILTGDVDQDEGTRQLHRGIEQLSGAFIEADAAAHLARAGEALDNRNVYQCMKALRLLLPIEDILLSRVSQ